MQNQQRIDKPSPDRWAALPWVIAVGLLLRIGGALATEQISHPDELFQYLEQAHRLTYGYGTLPWEYVHGIRNWLLPGLLSLVLSSCRALGIDDPDGYILGVQILACIVSVSAIYCTYWIGRQMGSEAVGRVASLLTCFWYEMVMQGHRATPEILGAYLLLGAITCLVRQPTRKSAFGLGLCCGLAVALRLQYAPAVAAVALLLLLDGWRGRWSLQKIAIATAGLFTIVLVAGWLDYYVYGSFFVSYYNNYLYNKVYEVSSLWGEQSLGYYLAKLGVYSAGLFWVAIVGSLLRRGPKPWRLLTLLVSIWLPHTLIAHKEYRFIFAAIPLCLVLTAIVFVDLSKRLQQRLFVKKAVFGTLGLSIVTGLLVSLLTMGKNNELQAYLYLNDQPGVVSVLNLSSPWYDSGGYYYLHRDVPIYFPNHIDGISVSQLSRYISHVVCLQDYPSIPGFTVGAQFGWVDVRTADAPPPETLAVETRRPEQVGVDDIFLPKVTPRF
ncbi:MAG: glycosyltransferase family 39 protein [Cyanobacteria bacterium P01_A01_bin.114]